MYDINMKHQQNLRSCFHFWLTLFVVTLSVSLTCSVELKGTEKSFIKYSVWRPCQNGTLSFEFKTQQRNALLLYMDAAKSKDFIEIKLVGGSVVLVVKLGERSFRLSIGDDLNDLKWHTVQVVRNFEHTTLIVDRTERILKSIGDEHDFGNDNGNNFVFIGGIPPEYSNRMSELSQPLVLFEPKLQGSIRNVLYRNCGGQSERPDMLEFEGIRSSLSDQCESHNPCQNGGICLSTDDNVLCDCSSTEFGGNHCKTKKTFSDATFFGTEFLKYDLSSRGDAYVSSDDKIVIEFKTRHSEGFLFYTGQDLDYTTIGLLNGQVFVAVNLGSGGFQETLNKRVNDNKWHTIELTREARETEVRLDNRVMLSKTTSGDFTLLSSSTVFVAGHPPNKDIPGSLAKQNFKGCLRKVQYKADSMTINIIEDAKSRLDIIKLHGNILFDQCRDIIAPQPFTFTKPESYITLHSWQAVRNASITFRFRTTETTGLLMYNGGTSKKSDFFALEIINGHLHFIMDMGSGVVKKKLSGPKVSDGVEHVLKLSHTKQKGTIRLDRVLTHYESQKHTDSLNLGGLLYVGGVAPHKLTQLPKQIWTGTLKAGFVGCMRDLVVNTKKIDLSIAAKNQGVSEVSNVCSAQPNQCLSAPCLHRGVCRSGWNRFICDCAATGYTGSVCQKVATTFTFKGEQNIMIPLPADTQTETDRISLRFKTIQPDGLLFTTTSDQSADSMVLLLQSGSIQLMLNLGSGGKTLRVGSRLNNDQWHTVFIHRRGKHVELRVDNSDPVKGKIRADSPYMHYSSLDLGERMSDTNSVYSQPAFIGSMQQFIFNNVLYFELIIGRGVPNVHITANVDSTNQNLQHPITIQAKTAFVTLPVSRLQSTYATSLFFSFRTTERDGIILYTGVRDNFLAVELTEGYLVFVYNIQSRMNRIRVETLTRLNDNEWHEVTIMRQKRPSFIIRVDDQAPTEDILVDPSTPTFDFSHHVYIGGVKKYMYKTLPVSLISRHGFQGCIASIDINGFKPDLISDAKSKVGSIAKGCTGPRMPCKPDSCLNKGRCIQHWTKHRCDCDKTSYTGPRCAGESVSYKFGDDLGIMTYTFPIKERLSTKSDYLALGFTTFSKNCVLVRVDSTNTDDYIELEIADGNVYVVYNMGTADYPIGELFAKVNDGKYHVVRYERRGPNSTIELDNLSSQSKTPEGKQLSEFNEQSTIQIGGKKRSGGGIDKPFTGVISGLVYNGIRVLDLASDNDPKVTREGDVDLEMDNNNIITYEKGLDVENWQSTQGIRQTTPPRQGVSDDIIFASVGSGCHNLDDEDCSESAAGHEDDIITPVITVTEPTSKPRSDKPSIPTPEKNGCSGKGNCSDKDEQNGGKPKGNGNKNKPRNKNGKGNGKWKNGNKPEYNNVHEKDHEANITSSPEGKVASGHDPDSSAELDLGLIIGIAVGVLVALVILVILLYKFRSRDEGAYKVEETQTFAFVAEGNKTPQANGNSKGVNNHATKSKKRDVKEWYV